jgi:hypothetical protein
MASPAANKQFERTVTRRRARHVVARPLNCGVEAVEKAFLRAAIFIRASAAVFWFEVLSACVDSDATGLTSKRRGPLPFLSSHCA